MNKEYDGYIVKSVDEDSSAKDANIVPGCRIIAFNNQPFIDIIDYIYFSSLSKVKIEYVDQNKKVHVITVIKPQDEPLGMDFEGDLLDDSKTCKNHCIFCFVDQLPKGMRKSLYHKDEDWRYSFIYGNYVTLANLNKTEYRRIVRRKIPSLFISVHATSSKIRKFMLGNDKAVSIKMLMRGFARHRMIMDTQIVLCKGINDGKVLENSIKFLYSLYPYVNSVSIVPAGITQFRKKLYAISDFTMQEAQDVVHCVQKWQEKARKQKGNGFVYVADEMVLKAHMKIPSWEYYDNFPQIENGVGMIRKFEKELYQAIKRFKNEKPKIQKISMVTGSAFFKFLKRYCEDICKLTNIEINCYECKNEFFGGKIDVAGLLTATDLLKALEGKKLGERLLLSQNMLRENEQVFLDDISVQTLGSRLGCRIQTVSSCGYAFVDSFFKE